MRKPWEKPDEKMVLVVSIRVDMTELQSWEPDRIRALLDGVAQCVAAAKYIDPEIAQAVEYPRG